MAARGGEDSSVATSFNGTLTLAFRGNVLFITMYRC